MNSGHIDALDGVRGVATLMVVLIHLRLLGCGWIGLQLFFVLSGFLITRILLRDIDSGSLKSYLVKFYWRRVLRICPALYLYLLIMLVASFLVPSLAPLRERIPYASVYVFNFWIPFAGTASESPELTAAFNHLWSLSVEEHFYLVWPLVVYLLGPRRLKPVAVALVLLGPVVRALGAQWWTGSEFASRFSTAGFIYFFSGTHVDAFACGALACLIRSDAGQRFRRAHWLLFVGIAYLLGVLAAGSWGVRPGRHGFSLPLTLGYPIFMANGTQFVWGYTLVNVACAYLLVLAIQDRFVSRLMQFPPFILTGRISYGIYFYHHPLVYLQLLGAKRLTPLFGSYWAAFLVLLPLCVAAIYGLAWASYRYFESPFLRLKDRPFWRSGASAGRLEPPVRTEGAGRPEPRPAEVQN